MNDKTEEWVPVPGEFSHFGVLNRKGELCCDGQDDFSSAAKCAMGCDAAHPDCAPHRVHACFLVEPMSPLADLPGSEADSYA